MVADDTMMEQADKTKKRAYEFAMFLRGCIVLFWALCGGCSTTTSMYVWQPPQVDIPPGASVAIAPISGDPLLAATIEQALLAQRPLASADVAVFTPEQLQAVNPVRFASTASINHDATALLAAQAAGASVLLQGEITRTDLTLEDLLGGDASVGSPKNMNQLGLQRLFGTSGREQRRSLLLTWRCLEVPSGRLLGASTFNLNTERVALEYPDLEMQETQVGHRLVAAAARETWKSVAPVVTKADVRLASPWLQPGSMWVRYGNRAAKKGNWELAGRRWENASKWFWFNAPARHNLAIAQAAQEDFRSAKVTLSRARGPLAVRLPSDTLFWIDQHHRSYHRAHMLDDPAEGWAIPQANEMITPSRAAPPVDLDDLPWWTAIPLAKPSGWTWKEYMAHVSP